MPTPALPLAQRYGAWVLAGPTGVGKTSLALALAEAEGAEIVGADAFQIYRGLPILTAQPSPEEQRRIPHHLVGFLSPRESFDAGRYLQAAEHCFQEIRARGRRPLLVGGTGLYLRALLQGLADLPPANPQLRAELSGQPLPELLARLRELDPLTAGRIDACNPRRVVRALEVCLLTGRPFSAFRQEWSAHSPVRPTGVWLDRAPAELAERLSRRAESMFAAGVFAEVAALPELGPTASQTLGLAEVQAHLAGRLSRAECLLRLGIATRQYAKRQRTWFRREPALTPWLLPPEPDLAATVAALRAHLSAE